MSAFQLIFAGQNGTSCVLKFSQVTHSAKRDEQALIRTSTIAKHSTMTNHSNVRLAPSYMSKSHVQIQVW